MLHTGTVTLGWFSSPAIQTAAVFGKGFSGWCPFHSSPPQSLKINLNLSLSLSLFGFVWVSLFKHTRKHKLDSS